MANSESRAEFSIRHCRRSARIIKVVLSTPQPGFRARLSSPRTEKLPQRFRPFETTGTTGTIGPIGTLEPMFVLRLERSAAIERLERFERTRATLNFEPGT